MTDLTTKRITYDFDGEGDAPASGDVLRTARGRCRLVVEARRVRSRVHPSRWALRVVSIEPPLHPSVRVLSLRWNPRNPKH